MKFQVTAGSIGNFGKFPIDVIKTDIDKNDSAINAELGFKPLTFAYAYNTKRPEGMVEVYRHHIGSRLLQISLGSKWTAANLEKRLQQLLKAHGWQVTMTHGITYGYDHFKDPNILWNYLKKVKSLEDKIWVGTFYQVAAYTQEEKRVTFDIQQSKDGFTIMPTLHLDKALYREPLTALLDQKGLKKLTVMQNGQKLKTKAVGGVYQFDFDPFGGTISVNTH